MLNFKKILTWLDRYLLEIGVGFLLLFIPLYPKFPLLDIRHTWVYIRLEDLIVALVVGIWLIQLARRKISLKTPLSIPIFIYWLVGLVSLLHAIFILSPQMRDFFPHLGVLHYLRRLEYMVMFFIAAASVKNLRTVKRYLWVIALTFLGVIFYGFGQKFLGFPAFLTMNEEFAKGLPLYLPPNARMTSTFAGHYDLAAFLIIMIALWGSLVFGLRRWLLRAGAFFLAFGGFILLLFTASRISFVVYLFAVTYMLVLQKRKWLIIPVVVLSLLLAKEVTGSAERFGKTFRVERVVYHTRTGKPIATVEDFFITPTPTVAPIPTTAPKMSAQKPTLPPIQAPRATSAPQDNLPLGSGFLNLEGLSQEEIRAQIGGRSFTTSLLKTATVSAEIATYSGEFLIKRALVYDISFTTRFQGQWPKAIEAFKRNIFLGSGFSSISIATDNDYLRFVGETGVLGFLSFFSILLIFILLVRRGLKHIDSLFYQSLLIGILAGLLGLMLNAMLIDVFEASKVAFTLWLLMGIVAGLLMLQMPRKSLWKEAIEVARLPFSTLLPLFLTAYWLFFSSVRNYFVGDDFTWLKWALTTQSRADVWQYFLSAGGFFYRPLAKVYFYFASSYFGLRPHGYHIVDLLVHFGCVVAAYFIVRLITKKSFISTLTALLFLVHPINAETIFWISATSHLFASLFYLWGFLAYVIWRKFEKWWRWPFFIISILAFILGLSSHERMLTFPLIIIFYDFVFLHLGKTKKWALKIVPHLPFWAIASAYLWIRNVVAQSHGLSGDYNYSLKNSAFNLLGNLWGYLGELIAGFHFIPVYDWSRAYLRSHKMIALLLLLTVVLAVWWLARRGRGVKWQRRDNVKLVIFSFGWFVILLLPFLGLGNIAERYVYPAHLGFFLILGLTLEWLYGVLKRRNRWLALSLVIVLAVSLAGFNIRETKKTEQDWFEAGETVNKILLALSSNFTVFPQSTTMYFVNLPIRQGRAWLFPVGLEDGLWFIYRDESLIVNRTTDIEATFDEAEKKVNTRIFLYEDGNLKRAVR